MCASTMSANPAAWTSEMIRRCTASTGMRRSAPSRGGGGSVAPDMIKGLYKISLARYSDQVALPNRRDTTMSAPRTTIGLGDIEVRFLVEADDSQGAATVFECQ